MGIPLQKGTLWRHQLHGDATLQGLEGSCGLAREAEAMCVWLELYTWKARNHRNTKPNAYFIHVHLRSGKLSPCLIVLCACVFQINYRAGTVELSSLEETLVASYCVSTRPNRTQSVSLSIKTCAAKRAPVACAAKNTPFEKVEGSV